MSGQLRPQCPPPVDYPIVFEVTLPEGAYKGYEWEQEIRELASFIPQEAMWFQKALQEQHSTNNPMVINLFARLNMSKWFEKLDSLEPLVRLMSMTKDDRHEPQDLARCPLREGREGQPWVFTKWVDLRQRFGTALSSGHIVV